MSTLRSAGQYAVGFSICLLIRLIPFRPPNIEPILATQMPFAKAFGYIPSFLFAIISILVYDGLTSGIGIWTVVTAAAYGLLGLWAVYFFKKRKATAANFALCALVGTILYDALTGLTIGPIFFHQPFMAALIGQIPFTLLHLIGNCTLAVLVSPLIYRYIAVNPYFETQKLFIRLQIIGR